MAQDKDDAPEWGPAMGSLNDKQRRFVMHLFDQGETVPVDGRGLNLYAAHKAGYGNPDGSTDDRSLSVTACNLRKRPAVVAAIKEHFAVVIGGDLAPAAARELRYRLLDRSTPNDQLKAVLAIADRLAPVEQKVAVKLKDRRAPSEEVTAAVLQKIHELALRAGLPAPPPPIDADYRVVEP
jgi:phage terminase small subunit